MPLKLMNIGHFNMTRHEPHCSCIRDNCPGFTTKDEGAPSSPDSNSLYHCLWAVLESEPYPTPHPNTEALKAKLERVWNKISMETMRTIINDFSGKLRHVI